MTSADFTALKTTPDQQFRPSTQQQGLSERIRQRIAEDMQWQGEVSTRYCVLYLKERKEHRTAWFKSRERAGVALELMRKKYGEKNAIIWVD